MIDELKKLKELQDTDTEFLRIQRSIKTGPIEEQNAKAVLDDTMSKLGEKENEIRQEQMTADEKNLELNTFEEEILKLKEKMNTVKNNKEYTVVKDAMTSVNTRKEEVEGVVLQHMERVDELKPELEKLKEEAEKAEQELQNIKDTVAEQIKELKEQAITLKEKRSSLAGSLSEETLEEYEYMLRSSKGLAVAELKDGACQGCFRQVPQNIISKVKIASNLTKCMSCSRFLYEPEGA
ncbi:MAG: zinc ribbon domain-containing protein [Planctomycetota bacterium]|jgi:predicted  nucleic acid-binding Zn-ribbon protein